MKKYWLMKSEPDCFSIDDLMNAPKQTTSWDGVRNYQARNFIRDQMQPGDEVFFYHSNCTTPAIVGMAEVISPPYPDHTAFDPRSEHPDLASDPNNPRWFMVDIQFRRRFPQAISLQALKHYPELREMILLKKGNRLSVLPVSPEHWAFIQTLTLKDPSC